MAREISQRELRNESGEIMRRVNAGETFVVTSNGRPVAELAPLHRHRFVRSEAVVALFRNAARVDYQRFRQDLDDVSSQNATPRG
jgi:prevent-host-death family protein